MNLGDLMVSLSNHEVAAPVVPTLPFDRLRMRSPELLSLRLRPVNAKSPTLTRSAP